MIPWKALDAQKVIKPHKPIIKNKTQVTQIANNVSSDNNNNLLVILNGLSFGFKAYKLAEKR